MLGYISKADEEKMRQASDNISAISNHFCRQSVSGCPTIFSFYVLIYSFYVVSKGRLQKKIKKSNWNFPIGVSTLPPPIGKKIKNFICLFHVSEHFKATFFIFFSQLENDPSLTPPPLIGKFQLDFFVLFLKPSLSLCKIK